MPLRHFCPSQYDALLTVKAERITRLFSVLRTCPHAEVFPSAPDHFRMRAEFRIWHDDNGPHYVMFAPGNDNPVHVTEFPIASHAINNLMPALLEAIAANKNLTYRWFQVEFLTSTLQEALVTLVYHKHLDETWQHDAHMLAQQFGISIIGRSRKQRIVIGADFIEEEFIVNSRIFHYVQPEGAFTQPNASVNKSMLQWVIDQASGLSGDLLELYCGIGNFTLPLSTCFQKVLATEVSKSAIQALEKNITANNCHNITHARLAAEEMTQALNRTRPFRRLSHISLDEYLFSTIFVDPPRAGLDNHTRNLVQNFEHIIYVSCNPETLLRDILSLEKTHEPCAFAVFDQFPYTHHAECGMHLKKR